MTRIVGITMVRNEQDIIEAFVRYHASFMTHLYVVDHLSTDQTPTILERLVNEGLPLTVSREMASEQRQSEVVTHLARHSLEPHNPDWIVPLDGDELLAANATPVGEIMGGLSANRVATVGWKTYVPTKDDATDKPSLFRRMRHRRSAEDELHRKILIPAPLLADTDLVIEQGNHGLRRPGDNASVRIDSVPAEGLYLAHFPIRGREQLRRKVLIGWPSHVARPARRIAEAFHWQALFERLLEPQPLTDAELSRIALSYSLPDEVAAHAKPVLEPFIGFEPLEELMDWPDADDTETTVASIARATELLAREIAGLKSTLSLENGTDNAALLSQIFELKTAVLESALESRRRDDRFLQLIADQMVEVDRHRREVENLRTELEIMRSSKSWRWTALLRRLEKLRRR